MNSQIFYIEPSDNLDKVRQELRKSQKEKIVLVLPEENRKLKNIESLTILKKEAQSLGKRLAIFSTDLQYKKLAEDCGIEIEGSLIVNEDFSSSKNEPLRPKISDILPKNQATFSSQAQTREKIQRPEISNVNQQPFVYQTQNDFQEEKTSSQKNKWLKPFIWTLLVCIFGGGAFFAFNYLPRANINIVPVSEEIDFSGQFTVQKDAILDAEAKIVPGMLIEKSQEIEKSFLATKTEDKNEKARGTITIYNEDSSSHRFVPNTRFKSEDGKIFKSTDWVSIPAGSKNNPTQVQVEVVADEPGEEYNIGPTNFTIPGLEGLAIYNLIYAKSTEPMSGGFVGTAKVVGEEDLEKAKTEMEPLVENLAKELKDEVLKEMPSDLQPLLENLIVVEKGEIIFDKKAGDVGETFKGKAKVTAKVLSFNEDDVQEIIAKIISSKVKDEVDFEEIVSSQEIKYEVLKNDLEKGTLEVAFEGKEKIAWKVSADQIKKEVAGLDESGFQKYIEEDMAGKITDGTATLWPFWVKKIPQREDRIFIEIKYR